MEIGARAPTTTEATPAPWALLPTVTHAVLVHETASGPGMAGITGDAVNVDPPSWLTREAVAPDELVPAIAMQVRSARHEALRTEVTLGGSADADHEFAPSLVVTINGPPMVVRPTAMHSMGDEHETRTMEPVPGGSGPLVAHDFPRSRVIDDQTWLESPEMARHHLTAAQPTD